MDRIEDCVSFLVGKAAQQVTRRTREALAPHGVTPVQYAVLSLLDERDGQSAAALGARLVLDSATMTGVVDRLAEAGLVRRSPAADGDRRVVLLFMTEKAKALAAPLDLAMRRLNQAVAEELGPEREVVWAALRRLAVASRS